MIHSSQQSSTDFHRLRTPALQLHGCGGISTGQTQSPRRGHETRCTELLLMNGAFKGALDSVKCSRGRAKNHLAQSHPEKTTPDSRLLELAPCLLELTGKQVSVDPSPFIPVRSWLCKPERPSKGPKMQFAIRTETWEAVRPCRAARRKHAGRPSSMRRLGKSTLFSAAKSGCPRHSCFSSKYFTLQMQIRLCLHRGSLAISHEYHV